MGIRKIIRRHSFELLGKDHSFRPLIIEIEPPDMISFRYKGSKTRYSVSLHNVRMLAVANKVIEEYNIKMEIYKARKSAGFSPRKPRRPSISMFNRKIQWAINIKPM